MDAPNVRELPTRRRLPPPESWWWHRRLPIYAETNYSDLSILKFAAKPKSIFFCNSFLISLRCPRRWFRMGTPEFPDLGKHCSLDNCSQLDFLPFTCDGCKKVLNPFSAFFPNLFPSLHSILCAFWVGVQRDFYFLLSSFWLGFLLLFLIFKTFVLFDSIVWLPSDIGYSPFHPQIRNTKKVAIKLEKDFFLGYKYLLIMLFG